MFDALNRKLPHQGVKPYSHDFTVLQEAISWLDSWENEYSKGRISSTHFLSKSTAEGLRITLHSALDFCLYITKKYGFSYLLTGKINQDPLEVYNEEFFSRNFLVLFG